MKVRSFSMRRFNSNGLIGSDQIWIQKKKKNLKKGVLEALLCFILFDFY